MQKFFDKFFEFLKKFFLSREANTKMKTSYREKTFVVPISHTVSSKLSL